MRAIALPLHQKSPSANPPRPQDSRRVEYGPNTKMHTSQEGENGSASTPPLSPPKARPAVPFAGRSPSYNSRSLQKMLRLCTSTSNGQRCAGLRLGCLCPKSQSILAQCPPCVPIQRLMFLGQQLLSSCYYALPGCNKNKPVQKKLLPTHGCIGILHVSSFIPILCQYGEVHNHVIVTVASTRLRRARVVVNINTVVIFWQATTFST